MKKDVCQSPEEEASFNYESLSRVPYLGRGIILGKNSGGSHLVQIYWISGRSPGSRNRIFILENATRIKTSVADSTKEKGDPATTLYTATAQVDQHYIVSNGSQTLDIVSGLSHFSLSHILRNWTYEPDPHHTSRIVGVSSLQRSEPAICLSMLRKSGWNDDCERVHFEYPDIESGFGRCITTYSNDAPADQILPPFYGEPISVPIPETAEEIMSKYWDMINPEFAVSMAVMMIDDSGRLFISRKNKYEI